MAYNQVGSHKTSVFTDAGLTRVVYHSTQVVKFNSDKIILDSGGYESKTTKLRINQTSNQFDLGYQVYQKDFIWYVDWKFYTYEFSDGMELNRIHSTVFNKNGCKVKPIQIK